MVDVKAIEKEIVVCDIRNCLNCGNCVSACGRRHKDVSRHRRGGSSLIGITLFPNLCRVCKEPRCLEVCNRNGMEQAFATRFLGKTRTNSLGVFSLLY